MGEQHTATPKVLVTGGSGFIGSHLVKELAERDYSIVSLYHHRLPEQTERVYPVCSDMGSPELLAAPLRGIDTVYHLAWSGGLEGPEQSSQWDPAKPASLPHNIQILRRLIGAMEKAGTRRIVFLSALGANRKAKAAYLREKYLAEFFILNSKIPEKVIVRSGIVWGSESGSDRFLRSITRVMKYFLYPVPEKTDGLSTVHIDELAPFLASLAEPQMDRPISVLDVGGETISLEEVFDLVRERRIKRTRLPVRGFLAEPLLSLFERESGEQKIPRLRDYLVLAGSTDASLKKANPMSELLPPQYTSLRDGLSESQPLPMAATEAAKPMDA